MLRQKTVSGVFWSGLAKLSMQGVVALVMVILARLLSKDDFGVVAMAGLVTVAIGMVNDKGLGMSIIQKRQVTSSQLSTMFWGSVGFGLLLFALSFAASYPLALFFRKPIVQSVVSIIAIGFVVGGLGIVHKSLLARKMAFKTLALVEMSAVVISGAIAVTMAVMGFGVWSLVVNLLARDILIVFGVWIADPWRPTFHFSWSEFRSFLRFSANVLANDGAVYLVTSADIAVIGRVLEAGALGVYNLALYIVKLPVTRLSSIVAKVIFPAFSTLQQDVDKFKKGYLKAITYISIITFPVLAGMAVLAREFIGLIFEEKWIEMALPLILLTPMAMLKSVGTIKSSVLMAVGRPDIELKWNLCYLLPLVGCVYAGTRYGVVGVAAAYTILYVITFPIIQTITNRLISVSSGEFIKALKNSVLATLGMIAVMMTVKLVLNFLFIRHPLVVLLAGFTSAVLTYFYILWKLDRMVLLELITLMKTQGRVMQEQNRTAQ